MKDPARPVASGSPVQPSSGEPWPEIDDLLSYVADCSGVSADALSMEVEKTLEEHRRDWSVTPNGPPRRREEQSR